MSHTGATVLTSAIVRDKAYTCHGCTSADTGRNTKNCTRQPRQAKLVACGEARGTGAGDDFAVAHQVEREGHRAGEHQQAADGHVARPPEIVRSWPTAMPMPT